MLVYVIRRSMQSVVVLFAMSLLVFVGVYAIGNPIDILINPQADQIDRERAIVALGLDKPLWEQYSCSSKGALTGDLGKSFVHATSALGLILERMPATMELAIAAMVIAVVLGIPLGCGPGSKPNWLHAAARSWRGRSSGSRCRRSGSAHAHHGVLGDAGLAALERAGPDDAAVGPDPVSFLSWDGLVAPRHAGGQPRASSSSRC
jgi:hypothetical protein